MAIMKIVKTEAAAPREKDLLGSRAVALLLWGAPWLLVIFGGFTGNLTRMVLWTVAFTVAGIACLANARRCGRRHCFYTGPAYLLAALASLLYGLHLLPLGSNGWNWIAGSALAVCFFACCVLEPALGKYTRPV